MEHVKLAKGYEFFPLAVMQSCCAVNTIKNKQTVEIGSGVCVLPGIILTAKHVAPTKGRVRRVQFMNGASFDAKCIKCSPRYDLALLKVPQHITECAKLSTLPAPLKRKVVCVGQQGTRATEMLQATYGKITWQSKHPLEEQEDIGGITHSCPVWGGSSGSPLFDGTSGELVGLHTGFDHNKFQAEAITIEAIRAFTAL